MPEITPLVAGNWKMNGTRANLAEIDALELDTEVEVLICPPSTLISDMVDRAPDGLDVGAQDCHAAGSGAHTGDISAAMVADLGGTFVIVGHSERRTDHGETDALIKAKAEAVLAAGLIAIVCVGETEAERDAGTAGEVVGTQIAGSVPAGATAENTVIAYEPVWAIGTGRTPTLDDIAQMHDFMRAELTGHIGAAADGVRLLYGGSVKPANAKDIFGIGNVNGGLVGGASLKAADFNAIIAAA
ncbi:MAG: triose-phosphate isomerase [Pseudomonadota bacterium]